TFRLQVQAAPATATPPGPGAALTPGAVADGLPTLSAQFETARPVRDPLLARILAPAANDAVSDAVKDEPARMAAGAR
ncbi:MAG: hypothetical protein ACREJT_00750, partial [Myxococcota bacterium]